MSSFSFSHSMPLQDLPCLSVQGSMLSQSSRINKRKSRGCVSESLDIECTPTELIQQWLPSHKHQRLISKGKENDSSQFVLARRSRKKKESMSGREHFPAPVQQLRCIVFSCDCHIWSFVIIPIRHFIGPPTWWAAPQDPLLPPPAGPPQDVHSFQALALPNVSLSSLDCTGAFQKVTRELAVLPFLALYWGPASYSCYICTYWLLIHMALNAFFVIGLWPHNLCDHIKV